MKTKFIIFFLACSMIFACDNNNKDLGDGLYAEFNTTMGTILIKLSYEKTPVTVANFVALAEGNHPKVDNDFKGIKYYNGIIFHRVIANFMIQGGGYTSELEYRDSGKRVKNESNNGLPNSRGTIAMARTSDPNSASAQFYINVKDNSHLDFKEGVMGYTVFGFVTLGMQVVENIELVDTHIQRGMPAVPIQPIVIKTIKRL